jgi:predicted nucleic acid-binding protein
MQTVYIDASSAILLYKTDLFALCSQYFSMIMETDAYKEVRVPGYPGAEFFLSMVQKNSIQVCSSNPDCPVDITLPENLDLGERRTLALYFQSASPNQCSFIIIDDAKGAKFCLRHKVPFINALLLPKILWFAGILNKNDYIDKTALVIEEGRYSRTVIEKAEALSPSDLALFIPDET